MALLLSARRRLKAEDLAREFSVGLRTVYRDGRGAGIRYEGPVTQPYGMREVSFQDPDGYNWAIGQKA
jgi:predicted DNA-binding transcriptional regulator YafY